MNSKSFKTLALVAGPLLAAYWYWSPLVTLYQMRSAARAGDSASFNVHVDYPKLRASLKGQLAAAIPADAGQAAVSADKTAKPGVVTAVRLGQAMALKVADKAVDAFVRPEVVMAAMHEGTRAVVGLVKPKSATNEPSSPVLQWRTEHKGFDTFEVHVSRSGVEAEQPFTFVMERTGFVSWRLTAMKLPPAGGNVPG